MNTSSAAERDEVIPALDGVRGIAILLVLAHNLSALDAAKGRLARLVAIGSDAGWIGVQLFFVLSGFLITRVLLRTREAENYYATFFGRRVLRIFPLYYAVLIGAFVVVPLVAHVTGRAVPAAIAQDTKNQIWLWTYLSNWASPFGRGSEAFPHFWSLAVEEQFYLFWPFVVRRSGPSRLIKVCLVLSIAALASRVGLRIWSDDPHGPYLFTVCRLDALCLGAACAALMSDPARALWLAARVRTIRWGAASLFVFGAIATRAYARMSFADQTLGYSLLGVVFAAFVVLAALDHGRLPQRVLTNGALRAFGKYSYGMYVFHLVLHVFVGLPLLASVNGPGPIGVPLALAYLLAATAVTFCVAAISYHAFELPFLRGKRRFAARFAPRTS